MEQSKPIKQSLMPRPPRCLALCPHWLAGRKLQALSWYFSLLEMKYEDFLPSPLPCSCNWSHPFITRNHSLLVGRAISRMPGCCDHSPFPWVSLQFGWARQERPILQQCRWEEKPSFVCSKCFRIVSLWFSTLCEPNGAVGTHQLGFSKASSSVHLKFYSE